MSFFRRLVDSLKTADFSLELFVIGFYAVLIFLLPTPTFDWGSYVVWADFIRTAGLDKVYLLSYVNYMPINIFALHIWQLFAALVEQPLEQVVHWVKLYPLLFDCSSVLLVLQMAKKFNFSRLTALFLLLSNIAFHYNSLIWGQFDSVYTFFVLASAYSLTQRKYAWAVLMFFMALNGKLQAIIFLPVLALFGLLQASTEEKRTNWPRVALFFAFLPTLLITLQLALFLPFSEPSPLGILNAIWARSVSLSSYVTFNADNFWILAGAKTMETLDTEPWLLGMTYKSWGYGLFFIFSGLALLPLGLELLKAWKGRFLGQNTQNSLINQKNHFNLAILGLYLVSVNFFYFLTQMHERYVHPSILFATMIALLSRRPWILLLTSIPYVLNMERVNHFWLLTPLLEEKVSLAQLNAILFGTALLVGYVTLFHFYIKIHQIYPSHNASTFGRITKLFSKIRAS